MFKELNFEEIQEEEDDFLVDFDPETTVMPRKKNTWNTFISYDYPR
jgi:hypothetical protein